MSEIELGSYLKARRTAQKLSIRKAAEAIGIDRMRLSDLERGINRATDKPTRPSRALTERIAAVYQVPVDYLLDLAGYARVHHELDADSRLLVEFFRDLDPAHRAMALDVMRAIHATGKVGSGTGVAAEQVNGWERGNDGTSTEG